MAKELERKFILINEKIHVGHLVPQYIKQAYLMIEDKKQFRIRIVNDTEAYICFKAPTGKGNISRNEFECQVPLEDGLEMYQIAKYKIEKTRYSFQWGILHCDCDYYPNGLQIVELEFKEGDVFEIPEFCGIEVTEDKRYSNIQMAIQQKYPAE